MDGGVEDDDERDHEAEGHQVPGVRQVVRVLPGRGAAVKEMR